MRLQLLICTIILFALPAFGAVNQQKGVRRGVYAWERAYEDWIDVEDVDDELTEQQYELLQDLFENKIDLNRCTQEDLEQLPFLSAQQIEDLMEYLYKYGPMKSIGELKMVESIDAITRRLLIQFVEVEQRSEFDFRADSLTKKKVRSLGYQLAHARQTLIVSGKIPTYYRKGDRTSAAKGGYLGPRWKHSWRYTMEVGHQLKLALAGSQDAGEPFFRDGNGQGYDYYTGCLLYKSPRRPAFGVRRGFGVTQVVVGRYRLRTGMGLTLNRDMSYGKISMLSNLGRGYATLTGHSSRSAANYLQGAAATFRLFEHNRTSLHLTAFGSWRRIDASMDTLSTGEVEIVTRQTTGYHRTQREMDRKNDASQWAAGGNINFRWQGWHAGVTGALTGFDKRLQKNTKQEYRRWYPSGKNFWNLSIDYGYTSGKLNVSGETATGDCGAIATVNDVSLAVSNSLTLMALQRFYSYRFYSLLGNSFASGGSAQDESGVYVGASWQPLRGMIVEGYSDLAYFAWPKYHVSDASHYMDNMLSASFSRRAWSFQARYRLKRREVNASSSSSSTTSKPSLVWQTEQRARLSMTFQPSAWYVRAQLDGSLCSKDATNSRGWMLTTQGGWSCRYVSLSASVSYFDTDDYLSRLYAYERGLLYSMSVPMSYGQGLRWSVYARSDISSHLMITAKVGSVKYYDRNTISSGMQQIDGSSQTDIELQLRLRL